MSYFRVNKENNYTVMSNYHLKDKTLSLKAIGLLSKMLSLPDDWDYSINGLVAICKEKKTSVISALNELKEHGYVIVTKKMPNETDTGRIEYIYDIYERPFKQFEENQQLEKQGIENLCLESQCLENQPQLNTNKSNTKELNTNKKNTKNKGKTTHKSNKFVAPSVEEVKAYCDERNNNIDAQRFVDYYQARGWMTGKNHIKDWKACVRTWERNTGYNNQSNDYKPKTQEQSQDTSDFDECINEDGSFDIEKYINNFYEEWYIWKL